MRRRQVVVFIFFISLFTFNVSLFAQENQPININNADELQYSENGGVKLRKLIGNVQLQQKDMILYCDQADFFFTQNLVDAYGNVHIRQGDSIDIYSDFLHYDGNTKKAVLTKNVKLTDGRAVLTTEALDYDMNTRIGSYLTGGTLYKDSAVLTSLHGYYYGNTGDVFFKKDVQLKHPDYTLTSDTLKFNVDSRMATFISPTKIHSDSVDVYCEGGYYNTGTDIAQFERNASLVHLPQHLTADTIYYERLKGFGIARHNIRWSDTSSNLILTGNYAEYYESGDRVLTTKKPVLTSILDADSLFIAADTLYSFIDTTDNLRRLFAFHHVRIFKSDMQGKCDSVAFSYGDSTFRLFYDPVLWVDDNQLTADTINVLLHDEKISRMFMMKNSFAVNLADTGMYNQVQGKNMTGYFENSELQKMEVNGNGESLYYAGGDSGGYIGANKAICSNMVLFFDSTRKVNRIYFITQPDATLYPLSQLPSEDLKLKNFRWLEALRPKSKKELTKE